MSGISKGLLAKAREAKQRAIDIKREELEIAFQEALEEFGAGSDEVVAAIADINAHREELAEDEARQAQLKDARLAAREAKRKAGVRAGGKRRNIEWAEGGRDVMRDIAKPKPQFHAAAQGMLSTVVRDIGRWETAHSYDNTRGVNRGELVMPVSDPYVHPYDDGKMVVDVLAGDQLVKGIPAAALRPMRED